MITKKLCQLGGLLLLASTMFILLSIVSYSSNDPTWNYYVSDISQGRNWGGFLGASLVDWGLQLLGSTLILLLVMGLLGGWSLLYAQPRWTLQVCWRGLLLLLAGSTLLALLFLDDPFFRAIAFPGGLAGYYVSGLLSNVPIEGAYGITGGVIALALFLGLPYRTWARQTRHGLTTLQGALHQQTQRVWPTSTEDGFAEKSPRSRFWARRHTSPQEAALDEVIHPEFTVSIASEDIAAVLTEVGGLEKTLPALVIPPAWEASLAELSTSPRPEPASPAPEDLSTVEALPPAASPGSKVDTSSQENHA